MKKSYKTPSVEVVKFQYSDQVVANSTGCTLTSGYGTDPSVCIGKPTYTQGAAVS